MAAHQLALGAVGLELGGEDADRDAGGAIDAAWPIGDGLAAAEADAAQSLVEFTRVTAAEFGEYFPLYLAREIRARARVRYEELREAEGCAQPVTSL